MESKFLVGYDKSCGLKSNSSSKSSCFLGGRPESAQTQSLTTIETTSEYWEVNPDNLALAIWIIQAGDISLEQEQELLDGAIELCLINLYSTDLLHFALILLQNIKWWQRNCSFIFRLCLLWGHGFQVLLSKSLLNPPVHFLIAFKRNCTCKWKFLNPMDLV